MSMTFNKLVSVLLRRKPKVSHWWRESGQGFDIRATTYGSDGRRKTVYVTNMVFNKTMPLKAQHQALNRMCWAMDLRS